jgi:uncharacterized protein
MFSFINRTHELKTLNSLMIKGGLAVITGRRRVGKTRLIKHWIQKNKGCYTQAIEAHEELQIEQLYQDLKNDLSLPIQPHNWNELLSLLERVPHRFCLCIDEFPYLVQSSPHLPSLLQKWLDHQNHHGSLLILSGSSIRMLNGIFLNHQAPLYGRANRIFNLLPMGYEVFCKALHLPIHAESSFMKYSLIGGIPKYWEWIDPKDTVTEIANRLFFENSALLQSEPSRLLSDENIHGILPTSVLEAIGRGAERPSEIAQKLQVSQQSLSKVFQLLLEIQMIHRDVPFGESERSSKKSLYRILDPACQFWYHAYSPHRSKWYRYSESEKEHILRLHASRVFEHFWRSHYPDCKRYWEPQAEFDGMRETKNGYILSEVKFKKLSTTEKKQILFKLENQWTQTSASKKFQPVQFEIIDQGILRSNRSFKNFS